MCEPGREDSNGGRGGKPSISDIFSNMRRRDIPLRVKLSMLASNNWRKLRTGRNCCGNLGQPGC